MEEVKKVYKAINLGSLALSMTAITHAVDKFHEEFSHLWQSSFLWLQIGISIEDLFDAMEIRECKHFKRLKKKHKLTGLSFYCNRNFGKGQWRITPFEKSDAYVYCEGND